MVTRSQKYKIVILWNEKKGLFSCAAPVFEGYEVEGPSQIEVIGLINEGIEGRIVALERAHLPVPPPAAFSPHLFSGKILLRIDPLLHAAIARKASLEDLSINRWIETKLSRK